MHCQEPVWSWERWHRPPSTPPPSCHCLLMVCAFISSSLGGSFQEPEDGLDGHYEHELPGQ